MSENYRVRTEYEESRYERMMADLGFKWVSTKLGIPDVPVRFITSAFDGEFRMEKPIVGLAVGSREIYLLRGLPDHELIETLCHEARHIWQVVSRKHCLDIETRERDARLFVLEANLPRMEGRELRLWLLREIEFLKNPELRKIYAHAERVMQELRSTPTQPKREYATNPQRNTVKSKSERISYIRDLLSRLPADSKYQRKNLQEELAELLQAEAVAA